MNKIKPYLSFAIVALVVIVGGIYIWRDWRATPSGQSTQNNIEQGISSQNQTATSTNEAIIKPVSAVKNAAKNIKAPDLNQEVPISASLSEEVKKVLTANTAATISELKAHPDDQGGWLKLAIYKKTAGDYKGAEEIWQYLTIINPQGYVAYNNLGDLYAYFLKDYNKAEINFLKALELSPQQSFLYRSLYEFYLYALKDEVKAKAILEKGIKLNVTGAQDLKVLLDSPQ